MGISPYSLGFNGVNNVNGAQRGTGVTTPKMNPTAGNGNPVSPEQQNLPESKIRKYDTSLLGGHGDGCLHCSAPGGKMNMEELQAAGQASMKKVIDHERMHQAASGGLAGAMQINTYTVAGVRFASGGSVPISIPGMNKENPELSKQQYQHVYNGATAPGSDMSSADSGVAATASRLMAEADMLINKKRSGQNGANAQRLPQTATGTA